ARNQPRALQHLQVPRHRRQADVERLGEFRNRGLAERQPGQDGPPRRVGESREGGAEVVGGHWYLADLLNNRSVKYTTRPIASSEALMTACLSLRTCSGRRVAGAARASPGPSPPRHR